ncbi:MAG: hypothetical protein COA71_13130 [SAR86 cluster bacterium]|uniref:Alpha/beta hydrolase domain-containing protein n=1 Tax=SAR86 cluster bacterium TaxID=2030880 RepID=A0A2A5C7N0_9GAMM|nr:MAG: hypothetical protein COA71_13130 [SAR86 cluster bacterium]
MPIMYKKTSDLNANKMTRLLFLVALIGTTILSLSAKAQDLPMPAAILTEVNIPSTSIMAAAPVNLTSTDYTEREFYAEGQARRHTGADSASLESATVLDDGWDYRTRVVVRAPQPSEFNGTLIVEWTNVTIGVGLEFAIAEAYEYLLREGYAIAIVSAQRVGVERSKTWSPERYGNLSVDMNICGDDEASLCQGDPLSFDIFSQITQALKDNVGGANAPLPGLNVEDAIAIGQSQSAGRLRVYYNTIQPLYHVMDGFVYWDRSNQLRNDQPVPALSVNSEATADAFGTWSTAEYTRAWDVAGATHASLYGSQYVDDITVWDQSILSRDGTPITSFTEWIEPSCEMLPVFSTVDSGLVLSRAIDAVRNWIRTGEPAAPSRRFERDPITGMVLRDVDGKVMGGIRLAQFDAPTAEQGAINGSAFPCSVSGYHRYYTDEELRGIYGYHDNYVAQVRVIMQQAVKDGYVLQHDAIASIREAVRSDVAK